MIRVSDLEASLAFYCDTLGLKEIRRSDYPKGKFTLIFLAANDDEERAKRDKTPCLEITYNWEPESYAGGRNFGHLAFEVDDIYQTCQHLMSKGVAINRPPRDGYMAFIVSPDNISIELLQRGEALKPKLPWSEMPNVGKW